MINKKNPGAAEELILPMKMWDFASRKKHINLFPDQNDSKNYFINKAELRIFCKSKYLIIKCLCLDFVAGH